MKILAITGFIGNSGFSHHSREFFTQLSNFIKVKIRNFTVSDNTTNILSKNPHDKEEYVTSKVKSILHEQMYKNEKDEWQSGPVI
mgnify:CR=1 FL=1